MSCKASRLGYFVTRRVVYDHGCRFIHEKSSRKAPRVTIAEESLFIPSPFPLGNKSEELKFQKMLHEKNSGPESIDQPFQYEPFENNVNPTTGEANGPRGPEPTRYGDWERKGRVSDF